MLRTEHLASSTWIALASLACGSPVASIDAGAELDAGAPPIVIASDQPMPWGVAISDGYVYWTNIVEGGAVARAPIAGGPVETIARGETSPARLAVYEGQVYWTNASGGTVRRAPIGGGVVETLLSDRTRPARIAVDATGAYVSDEEAGEVVRVALDGSSSTVLAAGQGTPAGLAIDDDYVYFGAIAALTISRVPKSGGTVEVLATDTVSQDLATDGAFVYWATGGRNIARAPIAGGPTENVVDRRMLTRGLALFGGRLYWTQFEGSGTAGTVSTAGGDPRVLASGQDLPFGIAADDSHACWANSGAGTVVCIPLQ